MPQDPVFETLDRFIADQSIDTSGRDWRTHLLRPPMAEFDKATQYFWELETTCGSIRIKLLGDVAPMHVSSTIYLTRLGFYDGLRFHRVIREFMAQGGCPRGAGTGGPGYEYDGEFDTSVKHDRPGLLSMANSGPGTDGSQFFLTFVPTPWLDGKHSLFGEVVDGMDAVRALEERGSESGSTTEPLELRRATVSAG